MTSSARINKTIEGLDVTIDIRGKPIRAIVTREALEVLWNATITEPGALLETYREHQSAIEVAIIDSYIREPKALVVLHAKA